MLRNFVLHVGIDDYSNFDGALYLRGAVNDARRWNRLTSGLALPSEQITVLADGEATRAAILGAVRQLAEQVAADPRNSGLITFSGHGAATASTEHDRIGLSAAICPSDVARDGDDVVNLICVTELEEALGDAAADTTIVIDACYTRPVDGSGRALGTGPAPEFPGPVQSRLIVGAEPWGESYEIESGGNWHGAMSFAMLTLLEQWTVCNTTGASWFNVSYGDLVYRTRALLDLLGLAQTPLLLGAPRYAMVPVLRPGYAIAERGTSPTPDKTRPGAQLSAGSSGNFRVYELTARNDASQPVRLAWMVVARTSGTAADANDDDQSFTAGKEYWYTGDVTASKVLSGGSSRIEDYRLTLVLDAGSWSSDFHTFAVANGLVGGGTQRGIAASYAGAGTWSSENPSGTSLGILGLTTGSDTFDGLLVTVKQGSGGSSTRALDQIYWFTTESGSLPDGLMSGWTDDDSADFAQPTSSPSGSWNWHAVTY